MVSNRESRPLERTTKWSRDRRVTNLLFDRQVRGAHCLSMEGSSFWLSHCPQSFYQTLGSSSSTLAFAGMSDVSVHRQHFPCTGLHQTDGVHSRHQSLLSLQARFYHKPQEVGPCPVSSNAPFRTSDRHGQGSDRNRAENSCNSGLVGPFPGLCSTLSLGDRAVGILPHSCSPVHVSSSSLVDSPERSLRHEGGSYFEADHLIIPSDPVNSGILVTLGTCVPGRPSSTPSSNSCPEHGCIHLWMGSGLQSSDDKNRESSPIGAHHRLVSRPQGDQPTLRYLGPTYTRSVRYSTE